MPDYNNIYGGMQNSDFGQLQPPLHKFGTGSLLDTPGMIEYLNRLQYGQPNPPPRSLKGLLPPTNQYAPQSPIQMENQRFLSPDHAIPTGPESNLSRAIRQRSLY